MNLQLIKSESFGSVEADIYSNGNDMFMTTEQLGACLEYSQPKTAISKILDRSPYLKDAEFSGVTKLTTPNGGTQKTRVFTEDGIYEVTMLSSQPKAKEFRAWIRRVIKDLRKGNLKIVPTRRSLGETNAAARIINQTLKEAGMPPQYRAVAIKSLYAPVGVEIPLDGVTTDKQLFDCTAIADKLGLLSKSGKPHNQAVAAIIAQIPVSEEEKSLVPFQSVINGHSGPTWQYTQSVVGKAQGWLIEHNYPATIRYNGKSYFVQYHKKGR